MMDALVRDVRQALRMLASQRGFAAAALITIALGVGGTAAVFSVVYGVLLRPLSYVEPARLVRLWEVHPGGNAPIGGTLLSAPVYHAWTHSSSTLEGIGVFRTGDATVSQDSQSRDSLASGTAGAAAGAAGGGGGSAMAAQRVHVARFNAAVFRLLRTSPVLGRFFADAEAAPGAAPVAVVSYATWRDRFGGDASIIGRMLAVDGVPHQIIGVAPADFSFPTRESAGPDGPRDAALYLPLDVPAQSASKAIGIYNAIARLKPDATPAQAAAEGTAYARSVDRPFAELVYGRGGPVEVRVRPLADQLTMNVQPALFVLAAGVGLVLLIACANVANLFLSRGADRARELAVRAALGADRRRLLRQLLTESLVISLAGGVIGMFVGWTLTTAVPALAPARFPRIADIHVDAGFLIIAALAAVFVGTVSGMLPAIRSSRVDLAAVMHAGDGRSVGASASGVRVRRVLLIVEAALAVVLLVGATLLARSFVSLMQVDAGYDRANVLTADLYMPASANDTTRGMRIAMAVLDRVRAMPGVVAAGAGTMTPFGSTLSSSGFLLPGMTTADGQPLMARALQAVVTPGHAEALGLRLKAGRFLRADDSHAATIAMLVNETFARMYLSDNRPIVGRRFTGMFPRILGRTDAVVEIVGVVGDFLPDALDARPQPQIYVPGGVGFAMGDPTFVIKTAGNPVAIAPMLREIVRQVEPTATLDRVSPLADKVSDSMGQPRFATLVLVTFAALALALATTGLYGVLSYTIAQRRREIGLRAALGATRGDLVWMVLREGLTVTGVGLAIGLAIASLTTRLMAGLLFGVTAWDAVAFAIAPCVLAIVATAACLIPARRAAGLDPAMVLKAD
jgi:putative ABC transport system permease protein